MTIRIPRISRVSSDSVSTNIDTLDTLIDTGERDIAVLNSFVAGTLPDDVANPVLAVIETTKGEFSAETQTYTDWRTGQTYSRAKDGSTWLAWTPLTKSASEIDTALAGKATTADVEQAIDAAIEALVSGAPNVLDTLNEIAAALGNDANLAATLTSAIATKANAADVYTKAEVDSAISAAIDGIDPVDLSQYYTSAQTDAAIAAAVDDIDLSQYYTSTQTDAAITAAIDGIPPVDLSPYYTSTQTDAAITAAIDGIPPVDLSPYYTSAQTDTAISSALAPLFAASSDTAGSISLFGGSVAPTGYLACDGSVVSREDYPELFAVIGTTFGEGDGESTFAVPVVNFVDGLIHVIKADNQPVYGSSGGNLSAYYTKTEVDTMLAAIGNPGGDVLANYRGFAAGFNLLSGDDPSVNQIIISTYNPALSFFNVSDDTDNDDFKATGIPQGATVAMVNVYGSNDNAPISVANMTAFFQKFVDVVLYNGGALRTTASDVKSAFYANFNELASSIPADEFSSNFEFFSGGNEVTTWNLPYTPISTAAPTVSVSPFIVIGPSNVIVNADGIAGETGLTVGDVLFIPASGFGRGSEFDLTATVVGITPEWNQGIQFSLSWAGGIAPTPIPQWPTNNIDDGGSDQYDGGNYLNTDRATEISYGNGNVQDGSNEFGGGQYVTVYQSSVFAMIAVNTDIQSVYYSGETGSDGDGEKIVHIVTEPGGGSGGGNGSLPIVASDGPYQTQYTATSIAFINSGPGANASLNASNFGMSVSVSGGTKTIQVNPFVGFQWSGQYGTDRPSGYLLAGTMFFDTTLGKPIWYNGNAGWVDANGNIV